MLLPNSTSALTPSEGRHLPVDVLRRYVAGTLEPAEQHRVEAHTLDCAHCADILEGLELQPVAVTDASVLDVRKRLGARVAELEEESKPAAAGGTWRQLAAAAVVFLTLGAVAWFTLHRSTLAKDDAIAARSVLVETRPMPAPPQTLPLDTAVRIARHSATPDLALALPQVAKTAPVSRARLASSSPVRGKVNEKTVRETVVASASVASSKPALDTASDPATKDSVLGLSSTAAIGAAAPSPQPVGVAGLASGQTMARAAKSKARVAAASTAPSEAMRTVRGRITDQMSGEGLSGVTVLVPGTQQGVATAQDGSFTLTVPATTNKLAVSSVGFIPKTQLLRPTDSTLALALAPDTKALSEVVVVRRDAPPMPIPVGAMPAGGYAGLKKYLRDSLDYPEKDFEARREGNVKLRFVVGIDGKLSDIKVVKKLSEECDAEAIRLLKEGPAWFPAIQNGRRTARTVEITVPFKLDER